MSLMQAQAAAAQLLYREGLYLDTQAWDAWLALYAADAVYWVPAWRNESELVDDVQREVSLIYHDGRAGLEERVLRIRSRKSVTTMPLPRTAHQAANVLVHDVTPETITGTASWTVHEYDPRTGRALTHCGRYEFVLRRAADGAGDGWKFQRKKVILLNDLIPTVIDFYKL